MFKFKRKSIVAALACTALFVSPVLENLGSNGSGLSFETSAYAKNGGGNGNGNGNGNGGGNGGGGGGGGGGAKSNSGNGSQSASFNNPGKGPGKGKVKGNTGAGTSAGSSKTPFGKMLGKLFNKKSKKSAAKSSTAARGKTRIAKATPKSRAKAQTDLQNLASLPVPKVRPVVPKKKNFRAKLAGLNSLNRNFQAYLNSSDPRMTAIREYVLASVDYENTSEELALAQAELDAAQTAFATEVAGLFASIVPYEITPDEVFDYNSADPTALQARKDELTTEMEALAEGDPLIEQITAEIGVIDRALGSQAATDLQLASESVTGLETEVETLAQQVTDEQLTAALEAAANKNRLAEYEASGETYVDEELLNWAKGILGVDTRDPATGEVREEVDGKIDEVREYLAADASDGSDASTDTVITQ